jgi:hypothetical protein
MVSGLYSGRMQVKESSLFHGILCVVRRHKKRKRWMLLQKSLKDFLYLKKPMAGNASNPFNATKHTIKKYTKYQLKSTKQKMINYANWIKPQA